VYVQVEVFADRERRFQYRIVGSDGQPLAAANGFSSERCARMHADGLLDRARAAMRTNEARNGRRVKPNKTLGLKIRTRLGLADQERADLRREGRDVQLFDGWYRRGKAELLKRALSDKRGGRLPNKDYALGLAAFRKVLSMQDGKKSCIEALKAVDDENALVGCDKTGNPLEGQARNAALWKWLERAEYWEDHSAKDQEWFESLKRDLSP
jgi:hypothetical protein